MVVRSHPGRATFSVLLLEIVDVLQNVITIIRFCFYIPAIFLNNLLLILIFFVEFSDISSKIRIVAMFVVVGVQTILHTYLYVCLWSTSIPNFKCLAPIVR
jgi:hypothetical protein